MCDDFIQHLVAHGIIGPIVTSGSHPKAFDASGVLVNVCGVKRGYLVRGAGIPGLDMARWDKASDKFREGMSLEECVEMYKTVSDDPFIRDICSYRRCDAARRLVAVDVYVALPPYSYYEESVWRVAKRKLADIDRAVAEHLREQGYPSDMRFRSRRKDIGHTLVYSFDVASPYSGMGGD